MSTRRISRIVRLQSIFRRRRILLALAAMLALYLVFGLLNVPRPATFKGDESQRVFTVYTEEDITEHVRILEVILGVSVADDHNATVAMSIWMKPSSPESRSFDLFFLLPSNSDLIPESNQNVSSSDAQVVRTRIVLGSTYVTQTATVLFRWHDFAASLRWGEWAFSLKISPFAYGYENWRDKYHSLMNKDAEPFKFYVSIGFTGNGYRFAEFYPNTGVTYGRYVTWSEDLSALSFFASGTYQHIISRQAVDFAISAFAPLVIGLIGGFLLGSPVDDESKLRSPKGAA